MPVHDPAALGRALDRCALERGVGGLASDLGLDRTRLWKLRRGKARALREPTFIALIEALSWEEARSVFFPEGAHHQRMEYADYLERALGAYGLKFWGLSGSFREPERFLVLFAQAPEWGNALGLERVLKILRSPKDWTPKVQTAARALEEAGLHISPINELGKVLLETLTRLRKTPGPASQLTALRHGLQRRWGRYSPETIAELLLAEARIFAPLLPQAASGLRGELEKLEGAEAARDIGLRFVRIDESGISLTLKELEQQGKLERYLSAAVRAELIRLDRPSLFARVAPRT